jgi:hypothetical protein
LKKSYKLILINVILTIGISILFAMTFRERGVFMMAWGILGCLFGMLNILIGVILTAVGKNEWNQAFLISGGVLFLLGVGLCGSMFIFL